MTTISPFLRLPEEIIIRITEELLLVDILRLASTCQSLSRLIEVSASIQYHIEREVAGVADGNSSLSSAERLDLLKEKEHNWATLQLSQMGGLKRRRQGDLWELFGGVLAFSNSSSDPLSLDRSLTFFELPSTLRGTTTPKVHHLEDLGTHIRDFGMDPTQDLLVTIVVTHVPQNHFLNLLTISTGQPHPMAAQPILSCSDGLPYTYHFVIQVMGDYLGVIFRMTLLDPVASIQDRFFLWNWKTGQNVLRLNPCRNCNRYDSFSFISPNHVVISRTRLLRNVQFSPYLEIYEFPASTDETIVDPAPYRTFELPQLYENAVATSLTTRSDPSPGCLGVSAGGSSRPFITSARSRLFTACLKLLCDWAHVKYVMFFINQETLLSDKFPSRHPNVYHWDEWGPQYARSFRLENYQSTWVCYVHGTRFVHSVAVRGSNPLVYRLQVLDFNPLSIKRYGDYGAPNVEIVDRETFIPKDWRMFADEITTSLPFRRSVSIETYPQSEFMIDEDVVIGLQRATLSPDEGREIIFLGV